MSARRGPHDTHFLNMPFVGVFSHQPDSLMGVAQWYIMVSVWHTVFQYGVCDALCVEPVCHIVPFVIHSQAYVSPSGTSHDSQSVRFGCRINGKGRLADIVNPVVL